MGDLLGIGASIVGGILSRRSRNKQARETAQANERARQELAPFAATGVQANQAIGGALGLGGAAGQDEAFQNFLGSTGVRQQLRLGQEAVTSSRAARGLLNSGGTLRRLTEFGQGLAQQGFQNFLGNLGGVANRGFAAAGGAANIISGGGAQVAGIRQTGRENFLAGLGQGVSQFSALPVFS